MKIRFQRFEEGLELTYRLFHETTPVTLNGRFYSVKDAQLLPRPKRAGGPTILVGGQGGKKTLSLAVRYADEWNTFLMPAAEAVQLSIRLDEALADAGRDPLSIRRSIMLNVIVGKTDADVKRKMGGMTEADCRAIGVIGTANAVADQLAEYAAAGLYRVVAQMNDLNDMDFLEILGTQVIPQIE
jgi:alkanesulfonate monooxygenase SsuD/methylene tetrahydromethanopterin reductase-like flavin-dependent oxidoreductase (luciferase family)